MKQSTLRIVEILLAVCMLVLGCVACLFSHEIAESLHYIIGGLMLAAGMLLCIRYFLHKEYLDSGNVQFVLGLIGLVLGVLIVSVPARSLVFISVVWGAWSVVKAIHELNELVQKRLQGEPIFFKTIFSIAELVLGTVLLMELTEAIGHHVILLGCSFISHGLRNLGALFERPKERK